MTYTLQQAQQIISNLVRVNIIDVQILANTKLLEGKMKNRIFKDGIDSGGGSIGDYSKKPISFPIAQMPNKRGIGKILKAAKKAAGGKGGVRKIDGRYFDVSRNTSREIKYIKAKNGYWEIRDLAGRQNAYVDLKFTGDLQTSITTVVKQGDNAEIVVLGRGNAKKLAWNEKHFNTTIGEPSQKELDDFINRTTKSIQKEINKYLKP